MKVFHFLKNDMTSNSGNEPAWTIGEERTYKGKIVICESGYHSSPSWYDALQYAPGNMACIVEISEPVDRQEYKYVPQTRKLVDCRNAEKVLRTWACDCAERALKRADVKDERSWNAIKIARLYNEGKVTKEELDAAKDAAVGAAVEAAWAAEWAAAWAAARDAEVEWQRKHLNRLMDELFKVVAKKL